MDKNAELAAQIRYLQRDTAMAKIEGAYAQAVGAADGKKAVAVSFENMDMAAMREAAGAVAEKYDCYVLAAAQNENGAVLCFVRGANCGIAMGKLLSETAKACGGKGGGRPDFAQGSAADAKEAAAYALERITKAD